MILKSFNRSQNDFAKDQRKLESLPSIEKRKSNINKSWRKIEPIFKEIQNSDSKSIKDSHNSFRNNQGINQLGSKNIDSHDSVNEENKNQSSSSGGDLDNISISTLNDKTPKSNIAAPEIKNNKLLQKLCAQNKNLLPEILWAKEEVDGENYARKLNKKVKNEPNPIAYSGIGAEVETIEDDRKIIGFKIIKVFEGGIANNAKPKLGDKIELGNQVDNSKREIMKVAHNIRNLDFNNIKK